MHTRLLPAESGIPEAAEWLRAGNLVAFPTETVYGLGADARRSDAVQKIYDAKGRPAGNPVIVHVPDLTAAKHCVLEWPAAADRLVERFWPGPLTLILPRGPELSDLVSAGRRTVAVRCPSHPVAHNLLHAFGGPIAAPSANRSGFTSPTSAAHVLAELDGRIPLILDGGDSPIGLESTVIDLSEAATVILRPGAITLEMLREVIANIRAAEATVHPESAAASPGLHSRHYAPRTPAYRFTRNQWNVAQHWARQHGPVALLAPAGADGQTPEAVEHHLPAPHETILMPSDQIAYARTLYAALRDADARNLRAILILMPHDHRGIGAAIADRLRRATLPLPS